MLPRKPSLFLAKIQWIPYAGVDPEFSGGGERRQTLWEGALTLYFAIISQIPIELKKSGQGERGEVDISQNVLRRSVKKNQKNGQPMFPSW